MVPFLCFCFRILASEMLIFLVLIKNNSLKIVNFWDSLMSKRTIGGHFWWNACTHFQKICSCLRHEHCKINIKNQISLVTLLHSCFRIIASKMLMFEVCLLLKTLLATTLIETPEFTSRNYEVNWTFQNHKKHKLLWLHSFVLL